MEKQTAGRTNLGELAPKFAELNDDVLFGGVWSREDKLSLRDRSMITISALMAQGLFPQLKSHFELGKKHGITKEEAAELKPGVVITIPANVNHWHGAKKDSWFSHIAIEILGEETSNEWREPVRDSEYNQLS